MILTFFLMLFLYLILLVRLQLFLLLFDDLSNWWLALIIIRKLKDTFWLSIDLSMYYFTIILLNQWVMLGYHVVHIKVRLLYRTVILFPSWCNVDRFFVNWIWCSCSMVPSIILPSLIWFRNRVSNQSFLLWTWFIKITLILWKHFCELLYLSNFQWLDLRWCLLCPWHYRGIVSISALVPYSWVPIWISESIMRHLGKSFSSLLLTRSDWRSYRFFSCYMLWVLEHNFTHQDQLTCSDSLHKVIV